MRLDKLDLNLLVVLDALLDTGSVSAAAMRIHLTQSAVSNALGRLRRQLGDPLLLPLGRGMVMSERGKALQGPVRDILLRIQQVAAPIALFDASTDKRQFTIAASDYFAATCIPSIIRYCSHAAPLVTFDFKPFTPSLSDGLDRGDIDLLVVPDLFLFERHPHSYLLDDDWVCVVSKDGPDQLTSDQFFAATHIVKGQMHDTFVSLDEWALRQMRKERRVVATVPQYSHLPLAVADTGHVAVIQRRLAQIYACAAQFKIIEIPIKLPDLVEVMQWNVIYENDSGLVWLRETLIGLFGPKPNSG